MSDVGKLIEQLPIIIDFFIPGYAFIAIFLFFSSRKIKYESFHIVACLVASAVIKHVDRFLYYAIPFLNGFKLDYYGKLLILVLSAIGFGFITAKITTARSFNTLCNLLGNKSIYDDVFRQVINFKGCTLTVMVETGEWITGKLHSIEEKEDSSWIALSNYIIDRTRCDSDDQKTYEYKEYPAESYVLVKISEASIVRVLNAERRPDWILRILNWINKKRNSLSEATANRDERIKAILDTGLKTNRITKTEVDAFYKLQSSFEAHNCHETYKTMQEILKKAQS